MTKIRDAVVKKSHDRTASLSPAAVSERSISCAAISTTANPRNAPTSLRAGTLRRAFTTRPSRATTRMSMGNRMKNVCTMFDGAMISACPGASESRPSKPRLREAESNAASRVVATVLPVRSLKSSKGPPLSLNSGRRKCAFRKTCVTASRAGRSG